MSKYSTSTYAYDVEAQGQGMPVVPDAAAAAAPRYDDAATAAAPYAASKYDDEAGRRIGMAMFACIVVGYALQLIPAPFIKIIGLIFYLQRWCLRRSSLVAAAVQVAPK